MIDMKVITKMDDFDLENASSEDFYAQVIFTVQERAPLLATPRLARLVMATLDACAAAVPGSLWGYIVLPESLRLIVGPSDDASLERFVEEVRQQTERRLLDAILRSDDESLDLVLRYTPVWGGVIYRVWEMGCHRHIFWTEYKLSNAVYEMVQASVSAGLVERAEEWPYQWIGGAG
jgi:REP element-mobilizing transposase RayT